MLIPKQNTKYGTSPCPEHKFNTVLHQDALHTRPALTALLSSLPPLSTCILHDSLVILNKSNNNPYNTGLQRETPTCITMWPWYYSSVAGGRGGAVFPQLLQNRAGVGKGRVEPSCVSPQAPFCVYQPLHGTDAIFNSKAQPWISAQAGLSCALIQAFPHPQGEFLWTLICPQLSSGW